MGEYLRRYGRKPKAGHICDLPRPPRWSQRYDPDVPLQGDVWACACGRRWILRKTTFGDFAPPSLRWERRWLPWPRLRVSLEVQTTLPHLVKVGGVGTTKAGPKD